MRILPLIITLLLAGCASDRQGDVGSAGNADNVAVIKLGVVESVTPIEMDNSSGSGAAIGSVFGQVGGASSGGGRGSAAGSILGSVLGGTLGHQSGIAARPGMEIWVRLDGEEGKSTYVMQPGNPDEFKVGDRVRVVRKRGESRVEHEPAPQPEGTPKEPAQP